jgi:hypothetical protein
VEPANRQHRGKTKRLQPAKKIIQNKDGDYVSDKTKWAYLAAMIDGEGFISLSKSKLPAKNGSGYITAAPRYRLVVSVTGTSEVLMKWLTEHFGGSWSRDKSQNPKWKPRCSWRCCGDKNKELLLLAVLPYLIIKRKQAALGLELLRMGSEPNPDKRERFYLQLKELNKRGVTVETNTLDPVQPKRSSGGEWRWKPDAVDPVLQGMIESGLVGNDESATVVTQCPEDLAGCPERAA